MLQELWLRSNIALESQTTNKNTNQRHSPFEASPGCSKQKKKQSPPVKFTRGKTRPKSWGSLTGTSKSNALRLKHAPRCPNQCHLDQLFAKINTTSTLNFLLWFAFVFKHIAEVGMDQKLSPSEKNNFRNPNYVVEICHSLSTKASWPLPVLLRCLRRSERACA